MVGLADHQHLAGPIGRVHGLADRGGEEDVDIVLLTQALASAAAERCAPPGRASSHSWDTIRILTTRPPAGP